jgi:hypothetical protein
MRAEYDKNGKMTRMFLEVSPSPAARVSNPGTAPYSTVSFDK